MNKNILLGICLLLFCTSSHAGKYLKRITSKGWNTLEARDKVDCIIGDHNQGKLDEFYEVYDSLGKVKENDQKKVRRKVGHSVFGQQERRVSKTKFDLLLEAFPESVSCRVEQTVRLINGEKKIVFLYEEMDKRDNNAGERLLALLFTFPFEIKAAIEGQGQERRKYSDLKTVYNEVRKMEQSCEKADLSSEYRMCD